MRPAIWLLMAFTLTAAAGCSANRLRPPSIVSTTNRIIDSGQDPARSNSRPPRAVASPEKRGDRLSATAETRGPAAASDQPVGTMGDGSPGSEAGVATTGSSEAGQPSGTAPLDEPRDDEVVPQPESLGRGAIIASIAVFLAGIGVLIARRLW